MMKLRLDRSKIREDVSMIELDVVQDCDPGSVMHHLGPLVEEGGVVFVGLDDKVAPVPETSGGVEVQRRSADEEPGREACVLENPREHRCRGGLPVRTAHRD